MLEQNWQGLIKPYKISSKRIKESRNKVQMVLEPLERGFGHTLGFALRRVLLSCIRGAAVTAIKVNGVLHEFSSITGVKEDIIDIILNIKELAIISHSKEPRKISIKKIGPGLVTAADIQARTDVEIINKELEICNLDKKSRDRYRDESRAR